MIDSCSCMSLQYALLFQFESPISCDMCSQIQDDASQLKLKRGLGQCYDGYTHLIYTVIVSNQARLILS